MLPNPVLSTEVVLSAFNVPIRKHGLEDYELGGSYIQDNSQGLRYQTWSGVYDAGFIKLSGNKSGTFSLEVGECTDFSFTFDQNMNPLIVWNVPTGNTKLYWYDPTLGSQVTVTLGFKLVDVYATLDDHRSFNVNNSDIILSYINSGKLYYRLQRERYLTEHFIQDLPNRKLTQAGLTKNYRFRWRTVYKGE